MIDLGESRADVLTFLRGLFAGLGEDERIELRWLGNGRPRIRMCDSVEAAVGEVEKSTEQGENVYFGVLPRQRGVRSGSRKDVTRGTAAWVDLDADIPPAEAKARVDQFPVKPSFVIKSGHGYHVYWLLSERVERDDLKELENLNRWIAERVGGDAACHDAARILRMPGTTNCKHEELRQCAFVGKPSESPRRYSLKELRHAALPSLPVMTGAELLAMYDPEPPAHPAAPVSVPARATTEGRATNGWNGVAEGDRNNELFRKACDLRERRVPEELALGALREWNHRNKPPLPEDELFATVAGVYKPGLSGGGGAIVGESEVPGTYDPLDCYTPAELMEQAPDEVEFTVGSLVPTNGVTIFSGEGGIGKSFIALDLAFAVASGGNFAEIFPCQQGPVIYIDLENDEGTIGRRLKQLGLGRGVDPTTLPLYLPRRGLPGVELQQDTPEGRAWLWSAVRKYRPRLIVIDSLIACHSGDENNNVLMRQLMGGMDGLARAGEIGLLVVHHQRKRGVNNDAGQLMRGASDLRNAVVSHFAARRLRDDMVLCMHDKCRPAQPSKPFSLAIRDLDDGGVRVELVEEGDEAEKLHDAQGEREERVVEALRTFGPRTPKALYEAMGGSERTGQRTIYRLARQGVILKWPDGMYRLTEMEAQLHLPGAPGLKHRKGDIAECAASI